MDATYAIDTKKKKAQSKDPIRRLKRVPAAVAGVAAFLEPALRAGRA